MAESTSTTLQPELNPQLTLLQLPVAMLSAAASVPEDMPVYIDLGGEPALVSFDTES